MGQDAGNGTEHAVVRCHRPMNMTSSAQQRQPRFSPAENKEDRPHTDGSPMKTQASLSLPPSDEQLVPRLMMMSPTSDPIRVALRELFMGC